MSRVKIVSVLVLAFLCITALVLVVAWDAPPRCQTPVCLEGE